jgi:putative exporter of polyketide antibiotics
LVFSLAFAAAGVWLSNRDLGSSVLKQSDFSRSRFYLLKNGWQLALRQNGWAFSGWALLSFFLVGITAGLTTTAINASADSSTLSDSISNLAGNSQDLKVAFLGAGLVFLVMILLIMTVTVVGEIRRDEAKQYLDNILVNPRSRSRWLASRLALGFGVILAVSVSSGIIVYFVAQSQNISLDFAKVIAASISAVGSIGFLLGLGTLLYGLKPRLATSVMYSVVAWSFVITLVASAIKLNGILLHSSLFQYITFNLAAWPDWITFASMTALGIALAIVGIYLFNKRDIVSE